MKASHFSTSHRKSRKGSAPTEVVLLLLPNHVRGTLETVAEPSKQSRNRKLFSSSGNQCSNDHSVNRRCRFGPDTGNLPVKKIPSTVPETMRSQRCTQIGPVPCGAGVRIFTHNYNRVPISWTRENSAEHLQLTLWLFPAGRAKTIVLAGRSQRLLRH